MTSSFGMNDVKREHCVHSDSILTGVIGGSLATSGGGGGGIMAEVAVQMVTVVCFGQLSAWMRQNNMDSVQEKEMTCK